MSTNSIGKYTFFANPGSISHVQAISLGCSVLSPCACPKSRIKAIPEDLQDTEILAHT